MLLAAPALGQTAPGGAWTRIDPAAAGWSVPTLDAARGLAERQGVTAAMVVHHGQVVADWGDTTRPTQSFSVRKSLLSALIGIAVAEGRIDLDATLAQLGIDDTPPSLSEVERQATVRQLLQARSGVYHAALYETPGMAALRPARFSHAPGRFFYYNNWDFNALGTIYERATGTGIHQAFQDRIAGPIGMQDYDPAAHRMLGGAASEHAAYPFRLSARDLARFALLYLNDGSWNGRQIVPAAWVRESTTPYSNAIRGLGYGYLWWTADAPQPARNQLRLPPGAYFAWGTGGQFAFVIPDEALVIVLRNGVATGREPPDLPAVAELVGLIRDARRGG